MLLLSEPSPRVETPSSRVVVAAEEARRRIERDLHDGAQQRFVTASVLLALARRHARVEGADQLESLLARVGEELQAGLNELRDLARGIHPAVLTDRGLAVAIDALAERCALPVTLTSTLDRRPEPAVESVLYFTAAEALTNAVKYADASEVAITVSEHAGEVTLEIADDGSGGADPAAGSGLRGLADRVKALGGRLFLDSAAGAGTTVCAVVPIDGRTRRAAPAAPRMAA